MASILCIDDDPRILDLYKALLEAKGYTVLTAPDGPTGLAITRKYSINVVVLDFRMPGMDGNQVARVLMQEHPKLPVVICSGFADEIPESLKWFADVVLEKGDGPDTLLSAIDKLIGSETKKASAPQRLVPSERSRLAEDTALKRDPHVRKLRKMVNSNREDWKALARKAANEQDPKKLLSIVEELNKALEERENQLRGVSRRIATKREGGNELLFVDDEPSIRLTLLPILQERGFHVQVAANVSEALATIKAQRFDVLLSDLNIDRESDGFTVVQAMREANPDAVTILLTGYPAFESAVRSIRVEVDDYFTKPADLDAIVSTIDRKLLARGIQRTIPTKKLDFTIKESDIKPKRGCGHPYPISRPAARRQSQNSLFNRKKARSCP